MTSDLQGKLIINAAITGMVPTKADTPHVPCSPEEIVADVRRCHDAGAAIVHIHARDRDGKPTYRAEVYREIYAGIRQACPNILISGSCSGRVFNEFEQRSQALDPGNGLRPDLGSLTLGSFNFPTGPSANSPEMIQRLAQAMRDKGILPELEVFDFGMIDYAHYLLRKRVLHRPAYCNLLLGSQGTAAATALNLAAMVRALPEQTTWSATGVGRFQFQINCLAVAMGGHVRVGLEDAIYYDPEKTQLATNPGLIDRIVKVARAMGRDPASPEETRQIIGLSPSSRKASGVVDCKAKPISRTTPKASSV